MAPLKQIVPGTHVGRRIVRRKKAWMLGLSTSALVVSCLVLLVAKWLTGGLVDQWWIIVCAGMGCVTAALSLFFRFTEQPREINVPVAIGSEPPVIH